MSERKALLNRLNETSFAVDEAVLFLDTHPCDKEALCYYKECAAMREEALKEYEKNIGPMQRNCIEVCDVWNWVNDPWPWEKGGNC